jgi:hypothetical protein
MPFYTKSRTKDSPANGRRINRLARLAVRSKRPVKAPNFGALF